MLPPDGTALTVNEEEVADAVQLFEFVTVTEYVPDAETEPLALFPAIPEDHA